MIRIPQIVHDVIKKAVPEYSQILTHFHSGTGNSACFVRDTDGNLWRVGITLMPPPPEKSELVAEAEAALAWRGDYDTDLKCLDPWTFAKVRRVEEALKAIIKAE